MKCAAICKQWVTAIEDCVGNCRRCDAPASSRLRKQEMSPWLWSERIGEDFTFTLVDGTNRFHDSQLYIDFSYSFLARTHLATTHCVRYTEHRVVNLHKTVTHRVISETRTSLAKRPPARRWSSGQPQQHRLFAHRLPSSHRRNTASLAVTVAGWAGRVMRRWVHVDSVMNDGGSATVDFFY